MATMTETRQPANAPQFVTEAGTPTKPVAVPPTLRARQAAAEQLGVACRLARRAISYAAEQVPAGAAETSLVAAAEGRSEILDLAADYLGYTDMADNLTDQVSALFMVEHARNQLAPGRSQHLWRSLAGQLVQRLARRRNRPSLAPTAA